MPVQVSYPGVYIEEIPSRNHTVTGVSTSATAFVDFFPRGPVGEPVEITNFRDFTRIFGGLDQRSEASYGLMQFFNNGGETAWVVRLGDGGQQAARVEVKVNEPTLETLAGEADAAAKRASADAKIAQSAAKKKPDPKDPGKPALDAATATHDTAQDTFAAAAAAKAVSEVLAEILQQSSAVSGDVAQATESAAQDAAQAAQDAATAAADAQKAADAAKGFTEITDENRAEAEQSVRDAQEAARTAAAKARIAADRANAAKVAGENAEEVGEGASLQVTAANPGAWGNNLRVALVNQPDYKFDLVVEEVAIHHGLERVIDREVFRGLTLDDEKAPTFAPAVVNGESRLVRLALQGPAVQGTVPQGVEVPPGGTIPDAGFQRLATGTDGGVPQAQDLFPVEADAPPGLTAALDKVAPSTFNLLCLPVVATYSPNEAQSAITEALAYAGTKRAFYLMDPPESIDTVAKMQTWAQAHGNALAYNAAVYFPRLLMPDPLQDYRLRNVGPSGTVAGVYARTDQERGVWKAPAGVEAVIEGARLAQSFGDIADGQLNPLGVNMLRNFPIYGTVVWGSRTMAGADQIDSEWKYVNVRRVADYIEESLHQSLKWVVFEDNEPRLWSRIRLEVTTFLAGLFSDGAFAGDTPDQAYLVACDHTTTTETDIERGIVNILVGFAPNRPAEFVILQLEQLTLGAAGAL